MVKINLFPKKPKPPITLIRDATAIIITIFVAIFITSQVSAMLSWKIDRLNREKKTIEDGIEATKKKIKNINEYKKKIKEVDRKISIINTLKENQTGPVALFQDLSIATPDQLWITDLKNTDTKLKLEGRAFTPNTVSEFMQNLSKSPYFTGVELNNIKQQKVQNKKVQVFAINCNIRYKIPEPKDSNPKDSKEETAKKNKKK
ncbi:MAG: PilN domain-containing protein [bacterium]